MMTSLMAVVRRRYLLSSVDCCTYRSSMCMHYPIGLFGNLCTHMIELLPNLSCSPSVIGFSSKRPWQFLLTNLANSRLSICQRYCGFWLSDVLNCWTPTV